MALTTGQKAFVATGAIAGLILVIGAMDGSRHNASERSVDAIPKAGPLDRNSDSADESAISTPQTPSEVPRTELASNRSSGPAKGLADLDQIFTLKGECTQLKIGVEDLTDACLPILTNSVYRAGRSGFTFTIGDLAVFTISGAGENLQSENEITQPVDQTIWSMLGTGTPPIRKAAVGACSFGDAYSGRATIRCVGRSDSGPFAATFVTDGRAPTAAKMGD